MLKHLSAKNFRIPQNHMLVFLGSLGMVSLLLAVFFMPEIGKTENHVISQEITADTFINAVLSPIVEVMAGANPTLPVLENRLGTKTILDEKYGCRVINTRNYKIIIEPTKDGALLDEVSVYPNFERFLTFEETASVLGAWHLIQESKTSSVLFEMGEATQIYVDMLDPPRLPASRILAFTVRNLPPAYQKPQ